MEISSRELKSRLSRVVRGDIRIDGYTRGRYSTDASIYQVMPSAVVAPRDSDDLPPIVRVAREAGLSVLARGGGTSQNGQTVNSGIVLDTSVGLNRIIEIDPANARCVVEPGVVLDTLNKQLAPHGLWFPVDVSTSSRATLGGMAGNNSCGTRSIRYGIMRDNVLAAEAILADGSAHRFTSSAIEGPDPALAHDLVAIAGRDAAEIAARFPKLQRRVGGYNLDALLPEAGGPNFAEFIVGSEGTLGIFTKLELKLSPLLRNKAVGVCHFADFHEAMASTQHLTRLGPTAIELIDSTMIELARDIPLYRESVERFIHGRPEAVLIVEFGEEDQAENLRRLARLDETMGDLGFGFDRPGRAWGGVVRAGDKALQDAITEVRQAGLNIMMSMKSAGKPVSFVEDCAVPLQHLADYTSRLTGIFEKHGTRGTWYAHASVGCLHVRPVLNLKLDKDVRAMRAIAEEAFDLVRAFKGSHSGEHGDGISRSEFHEKMFGSRLVRAFEAVKDRLDPQNLLNPGRIVRPPRMDDRRLFRYGPDYRDQTAEAHLAWSGWETHGFQSAVEMCNNNGACRKLAGGAMCPSFRVTRNERDVTRGRANTLRLALSGQLGPDALGSAEMAETMKLCVSCKACRRECPTGVDMARMKIEVQAAQLARSGLSLRDRIVAYLPRYAPWLSRMPWLANARDRTPGMPLLSEFLLGLSARRQLPSWSRRPHRPEAATRHPKPGREAVLFADTFNTYFEPENLEAARRVLAAAGYCVVAPSLPAGDRRPLCCGRTFLSAGLIEEARRELRRTTDALLPLVDRGALVVGLEPSCLLTLRDELEALLPDRDWKRIAAASVLLEDALATDSAMAYLSPQLRPVAGKAYVHGHCHQKSFNAMGAVEKVLKMVPGLEVSEIASSCCGMAGAFGYQSETYDVSMAMGELSLFPAVRKAEDDAIIIADGTSCRHQIAHGTRRSALHAARVLDLSLSAGRT
jgi:FAD/FMN-containing dehydrogenase/Fe-S oxidoreductase